MNKHWFLLPLAAALLASCHASPEQGTQHPAASAPTAPPNPATQTAPAATPVVAPASRPPDSYRRYRGTVGGQPVTLELTIAAPVGSDSVRCEGRYSYDRHPAGQLLLAAPRSWQPQQPLQLSEADGAHPRLATGRWQATQPAGPRLTGTWMSPAGQQLPFELREDYTDGRGHLLAVGYEILNSSVVLPCRPERGNGETRAEYRERVENSPNGYDLQFLHLLGPDTLRPGVRAVQCPPPRQRRQAVRAAARENGCNYHDETLQVDYNNYGLLACRHHWEDDMGLARPGHGTSATVFDLRSGEVVALPEVLRPGTDSLLRRLLTRHLLDGSTPDISPKPGLTLADGLLPLPGGEDSSLADFSLTNEGLAFGYYFDEVADFLEGGSLLFAVVVPYRELQPLLRPASPVARMLRERGLWQPNK